MLSLRTTPTGWWGLNMSSPTPMRSTHRSVTASRSRDQFWLSAATGEACNTKKPGICAQGTTQCAGGQIQCIQNRQADIEVCNNQDDDCDGNIDNNCLSAEEAAKLRAQRGH